MGVSRLIIAKKSQFVRQPKIILFDPVMSQHNNRFRGKRGSDSLHLKGFEAIFSYLVSLFLSWMDTWGGNWTTERGVIVWKEGTRQEKCSQLVITRRGKIFGHVVATFNLMWQDPNMRFSSLKGLDAHREMILTDTSESTNIWSRSYRSQEVNNLDNWSGGQNIFFFWILQLLLI